MKILITGGAGYIGSHTLVELINNNHDLFVIDSFINSSEKSLKRVMEITGKEFLYKPYNILDFNNLDKAFGNFKPKKSIPFSNRSM